MRNFLLSNHDIISTSLYLETSKILYSTCISNKPTSRSQWPHGLRRRASVACLLGLWVRIPPGVWMSVCWEFCMLSGTGLCDVLITHPEESCRLWCVVCDLETSWMKRPWPAGRLLRHKQTNIPKKIHIYNKNMSYYQYCRICQSV